MLSIVIPVFRNEKNIDRLVQELERLAALAPLPLEVVFVVDGSPDRSLELLQRALPRAAFSSVLVSLSRNFGAFNAVRCGLEMASGDYFAVLAADLQEPADLALTFLDILRLSASLSGRITVPGYAPTVLIVTFFGSITSLGLGIVGQYVWLILHTTRGRPGYLIDRAESFQTDRMMRSAGVASRR